MRALAQIGVSWSEFPNMLYVLYGTNRNKIHQEEQKLVEALVAKRPGANVFLLDSENFNGAELEDKATAQGLFTAKHITLLNDLLDIKETAEEVWSRLPLLAESDNVFLLRTGKLLKKDLAKLEKYATKIKEFSLPRENQAKSFNLFTLADALGERNKKSLWVGYQTALAAGHAPEEIHGVLWWQAKSMQLAALTASASESGLKPFVYSKAKRHLSNYRVQEITTILTTLVTLYHRARSGEVEMSIALESFMLEL
jgi:DNA polymerase III delta subunit